MRKLFRVILICFIALSFTIMPLQDLRISPMVVTVEAHSGRTDSSGGHRDNKNKSGLGSYHYHCGGNPPHLHDNGVCPYSSNSAEITNTQKSSTDNSNKNSTNTSTSTETIKKVQKTLNDLGYDCGKVDGILGKKTKSAIKAFQKDNDLTVDGKINKQVKEALDIE